jgi:hypothetical protein
MIDKVSENEACAILGRENANRLRNEIVNYDMLTAELASAPLPAKVETSMADGAELTACVPPEAIDDRMEPTASRDGVGELSSIPEPSNPVNSSKPGVSVPVNR